MTDFPFPFASYREGIDNVLLLDEPYPHDVVVSWDERAPDGTAIPRRVVVEAGHCEFARIRPGTRLVDFTVRAAS